MTKCQWQRMNESLMTKAQGAESERRWVAAAACCVALADLRDDKPASPLRERAAECWARADGA